MPETELRKATIPIFYDMIDVEFNANGNFKQVDISRENGLRNEGQTADPPLPPVSGSLI